VHRHVVDERGASGPVIRDRAFHADTTIDLAAQRKGVEAGYRPDRQRVGIRWRLFDDHFTGTPGHERHAPCLPRPRHEGTRAAAEPHARIDEPFAIRRRVIPEPRANRAAFYRNFQEEHRRWRLRLPGSLADSDDLHVVAVVAARHQRRVRRVLGLRERRPAEPRDSLWHDIRGESALHRDALDFDEIAPAEIEVRMSGEVFAVVDHELADFSVVDDHPRRGRLLQVSDRPSNAHAPAVRRFVV
jgi:hypothetical protein